MKKSKLNASSKKKTKHSAVEHQGVKAKGKSPGSLKKLPKEKAPRKSRWEEANVAVRTSNKQDPSSLANTKEDDLTRIKELLDEDKGWIVEQLFQTVSGTSLDELIPDYLKKRSTEELKKLCLIELEKMPNDEILGLFSGKQSSALEHKETQTDFGVELRQTGASDKDSEETRDKSSCQKEFLDSEKSSSGSKLLTVSNKTNTGSDDKIQAPTEVLEEVAKDLGISEGDSELLELEMRARAIRSLLKMKSPPDDSDSLEE